MYKYSRERGTLAHYIHIHTITIHEYTYIYTYTHVHIHMHMHINIHIHIRLHMCIHKPRHMSPMHRYNTGGAGLAKTYKYSLESAHCMASYIYGIDFCLYDLYFRTTSCVSM